MSYSFSVKPALEQIQSYIFADFNAQGEPPSTLCYSFVAEQYDIDVTNLPQTLIEIKKIDFQRITPNIVTTCLDLDIHHVRQRDGASNAELTAIDRLCHLAASLETDFKMVQYDTVTITIDIQKALASELLVGMRNPLQMALDSTEQLTGLCAVSMPIRITYQEGK